MKHPTSRICLGVALVLSLIASEAQSQVLGDDSTSAQWAHVRLLSPGIELEVRAPKKNKGTLSSVSATTLVIAVDGRETNFSRSEIREIKVRTASSPTREIVAAGIGAAGGLATAGILDKALIDGNGVSKTAAIHASFLGAIMGLLWGSLKPHYRTIYRVR